MDVAFRAVCVMTRSLRTKLSPHSNDFCANVNLMAEQMVTYVCQQCEASLQFLHSLCQQKTFRERVLRNKVSEIADSCFQILIFLQDTIYPSETKEAYMFSTFKLVYVGRGEYASL